MKSANILYSLGSIIIISSFVIFYIENEKEDKLIPVNCTVLNYECIGRAANTTFTYNDKRYSIGSAPRELCNGRAKKNVVLYYYKEGDSFYLKNSTNSYVYLYLSLLGFFMFLIPYLQKKANNYIFRNEFK
jgi:hypothetical protein